jgi:hypothetical protein
MRFDKILTRLTPTASFDFETISVTESSRKSGELGFSDKQVEQKIYDDYSKIVWNDQVIVKPTLQECQTEWDKIQSEEQQKQVADARRTEYPPIGDSLDALWHAMDDGVLPKIEPFYTDCKNVKLKYPKPY